MSYSVASCTTSSGSSFIQRVQGSTIFLRGFVINQPYLDITMTVFSISVLGVNSKSGGA